MALFKDKTAFITGGAHGIGLGLARAFAARGAKLMLADIDEARLSQAAASLSNHDVDTVVCDVADEAAMRAAADKTAARFGGVDILVNNAGVGAGGEPGAIPMEDWRWVVGINLMGVIHGVEIFTPLIKARGPGGYILNTASMAGHFAGAGTGGPYNATKFAVVGYSETLREELEPHGIGVSVLCPGWVDTDIHKSGLRRPSGGVSEAEALTDPNFKAMDAVLKAGLSPDVVGEWSADCMEAGRLYVFTHPEMRAFVTGRHRRIAQDYAAAETRFGKPGA